MPQRLEASFSLPDLTGNPFDYTQNDIRVAVRRPDGRTLSVPAFFDGGTIWRVRVHPDRAGRYAIAAITRNGTAVTPQNLAPRAFTVTGATGPGFVRRDPANASRFVFEDGAAYYPMGNDAAWGKGDNDGYLLGILGKMATEGHANWARVWMNHWDGKNLDWPTGLKREYDRLDLGVAARWDRIVEKAEQTGLYVQVTLQHHGPYSSKVDSNWAENPWNAKNGGFLATPSDFFTNPRAIALTKAKYRYIVARWGYAPHIMAWELFNEVQWCDPIPAKNPEIVLAWHREMAAFLRAQDPNHHLITTSSDTHIKGLYDAMDYIQPHDYPPDAVTAVLADDPVSHGKPYFFGEIGPQGKADGKQQARFWHEALWASLMSRSAGTAQLWYWDAIDDNDLYPVLRSAADFVRTVGPNSLTRLAPITVGFTTPAESGTVSAGPGAGWGKIPRTDLTVASDGVIDGISEMPAFLQGHNHVDMGNFVNFHVDYAAHAGTFAVTLRQIAKAGGRLQISVDGAIVADHDYPGGTADHDIAETVTAAVPSGPHVVRVENAGADWVVISRLTLAPYGAAIRGFAKGDDRHAVLWVRQATANAGVAGTATLPGLLPGAYRVRFWDTERGVESGHVTVRATPAGLTLTLPPVNGDIAVALDRQGP
jgi:hypothetical protein